MGNLWNAVKSTFPANAPELAFEKVFNRNYKIIKQFKRFPERNSILGRRNTQAEQEHLDEKRLRADAKAAMKLEREETKIKMIRQASRISQQSRKLSKKEQKR